MEPTSQSKTLILAEDDEDDVIIFKLALQRLPIVVELRHARDGEMLFELLRRFIPDIIFLDVAMPHKDGIACIVEIRKNSDYNHIPVIMYTSYKGTRYIDECYKNGANFYLLKGESILDLAEKLKKIFSIEWKSYLYYPPKSDFVLGGK